ncbi:MAG: putative O-glycosylation ligase, exosortase A system-associated [Planctomycetes bacterium]|nr:putative O-glycosylation ligase, exosortase A system-associated [Planctomycetota bacterium]
MRGMIVVALASLAIPLAFLSPFLGLLGYCWLSYMRPQDMAWGVGYISFGLYTAVALFVGLVVKLRFQFFRWTPITWLTLGLWAWWANCTYFAMNRDAAMDGLIQISRIFLICLVTTGLCTTKDRLKWVVVAIAGSLLFHGTKLGIHGVLTGGGKQLQAIGGLMSGNNENAIALSIALPFAVHFALNETIKWRRLALWATAALTAVAVICTYSRGGFLGMAAAGAVIVWHSRARFFSMFVAAPILAVLFFAFAPAEYTDRIGGIGDASKSDMSAQLRIQAWGVAAHITAEHPIAGIGPKNFYSQSHKFPRPVTMPDMEIHNTYLDLSSALGVTGLLLYLTLVGTAWFTLNRVRKELKLRDDPRLAWFGTLCTAIQASMTAFLVSSTFGSLSHFDLMYHLCAIAACVPIAFSHEVQRLEDADLVTIAAATGTAPAWADDGGDVFVDVPASADFVAPSAVHASALIAQNAPALSRYDARPDISAVPHGLPDFRAATRAPAPTSPILAAAVSATAVPDPALAASAHADGIAPGAVAAGPTPADDDAARSAALRDQQKRVGWAPPRRHTVPVGPTEASVDGDRAGASPTQLADMFIDPYGTQLGGGPDALSDTGTNSPEPPAPPRRSMTQDGTPMGPSGMGPTGVPYLSPLDARVLQRKRASAKK